MFRKYFPFFSNNQKISFLNNAATTLKPKQMISARRKFFCKNFHYFSNNSLWQIKIKEKVFSAKLKIAQMLRCHPDEVFFFPQGTTTVINHIAFWLKQAKPEGRILFSDIEHHSNYLPWIKNFENCNILSFQLNNFSNIYDEVDWKDLFLFTTTAYSNVLGSIWKKDFSDLAIILKKAKRGGAYTLVDGAQVLSFIELFNRQDLKFNFLSLDIDFFVFSAHKFFGPSNLGVLIAKKNAQAILQNQMHEIEKMAIWEVIEFGETLKFLKNRGFFRGRFVQSLKSLQKQFVDFLKSISIVKILSSEESNIITFLIEGIHAHDFVDLMFEQGVVLRGGDLCAKPLADRLNVSSLIRISLAHYNDLTDLIKFKKAFLAVVQFLLEEENVS